MNTFCFSYKITRGFIQCKVTSELPCPNPGDSVTISELMPIFLTVSEVTKTKDKVYHFELEMKPRSIKGSRYYFFSNGTEGMT